MLTTPGRNRWHSPIVGVVPAVGHFLLISGLIIAFTMMFAMPSLALTDHPCPGGVAVSAFRLTVKPAKAGDSPLPISVVNIIEPGQKLRYEPVRIPDELKKRAKVAVVLVPAREDQSGRIQLLPEKPADAPAEWSVPVRASVVGVVFGERGLDAKKLTNLADKNPELISDLADYAERTSTVEALVQALQKYEESAPGSSRDAVLKGFSSQYGVTLPKMDPNTPTGEQASQLLRAVVPVVNSADDTSNHVIAQQSTGLAASVGSLFLGTPVTLAIGSAALLESVHTSLFPATDFRPAFTHAAASGALDLCTVNQKKKAHTRLTYLWMTRITDASAPTVSLPQTAHVPLGWTSTINATSPSIAQLKLLPRAREWRLVGANSETPVPVKVTPEESRDALSLDLRHAKLTPGVYKLAAKWDWSPLQVAGTVELHPLGDFSAAKVTPDTQDKLIAWTGSVPIQMNGADFEFLDKMTLTDGRKNGTAIDLPFTLPKGKAEGEQRTVSADVDTSMLQPGSYKLVLRQVNGAATDLPVTVHPPLPKIERLPIRVNAGQPEQSVKLIGTDLERIEKITSPKATWTLAPNNAEHLKERDATVKLGPDAKKADTFAVDLFVAGMHAPVTVPNAVEVLGPRPNIVSVKKSFATESTVQLRDGELPAGVGASFAMQVDNLDSRPAVELRCLDDRYQKQAVKVISGVRDGAAVLESAGEGLLFLSVDPGAVGLSGCDLMATVESHSTGASDAFKLGRVIDLPQIEKFTVTDEKVGDSLYAGTLTGKNLQTIEKTGWNAQNGNAVLGIATPVPGNPQEQTLKIAVSWPSPSPHAPLFIWLRGESEARSTTSRY